MSELRAQKRSKNNTVHIYELDSGTAFCADYIGHPSINRSEPEFSVSEEEVLNNDYLQRDGEIIGKICGNCQKILR